jgi:hypothetical protein
MLNFHAPVPDLETPAIVSVGVFEEPAAPISGVPFGKGAARSPRRKAPDSPWPFLGHMQSVNFVAPDGKQY